jgi:hypothetical protein
MTLILGRFTSSFTAFAQTLIRLSLDPTDVGALARLRQAQEDLKQGAARNATWLTIIGIGNFLTICQSGQERRAPWKLPAQRRRC